MNPPQLPGLPPPPPLKPGAAHVESRFAECRRRVAAGCGGHHEPGPVVAGYPMVVWRCCESCPNRSDLNPWAAP